MIRDKTTAIFKLKISELMNEYSRAKTVEERVVIRDKAVSLFLQSLEGLEKENV